MIKRPLRLTLFTALAVALFGVTTLALFTNGGFEAGDFSGGWVKTTFSNFGLSGGQPYSGASIVRTPGGSDVTQVVGPAAPLTLTDPLVPNVQYPRFGQYAARVNYNLSGRNANALRQQAAVVAGDVDASDGLVHIRFAYLPVLESPGHQPGEQPFFYIAIRNLTTSAMVWERFTFANEAGVPWQSQNGFVYTAWQLVDVTGAMNVGDIVEIEVVAAGCSLSGHRGHVYVDAFGSTIPGGTVVATAPASVDAGDPMVYSFHVANGGTAILPNSVVSITMPPQTTFASVSDGACSQSAGVVTCNFGDIAAGGTRDFTLTVNTSPTASGTITLGTYSISGTAYPALLGPTRTTAVVNTVPTGVADAYALVEDGSVTVAAAGVLVNDSDPEGNPLTAVLVTGPSNGSLTLNADGSITYTPNPNFFGIDTVIYRASDGVNQSANTTVTLTVSGTPDAPVGTADAYTVAEDASLTRNAAQGVLANDSDPDGDAITATLVTGPANGSLVFNNDGSFVYTPTGNYNGPDSFTYNVTDGGFTTGPVTVSLTVTSVNDAPTSVADAYATTEDTPLTVAAPGVLANDADIDAGTTLTAVLMTGPTNGSLTLNANGSFTYTPNANYNGPDSFVYRASDGTAQSPNTTVSLTIAAVADAPTGAADSYTVAEDDTLTVPATGVLANDSDGDGDPLTAALVVGPTNGTLTLDADGSFVYTPDANYTGADSFTYTVSDGGLTSAPVTVSLTVTAVNDAPTAVADGYLGTEDVTLTVNAANGVLANDADTEGSPLTAVLVSGPAHGTLTLNADGSFTFVPTPGYHGADSFTYMANDGTANSAPVTVSLTLGDDADLTPGAGRDTGGVRVTIAGSGFGPAGTPVTVTIGGLPGLEAEVLNDGTITFVTPALPPNVPVDVVFTVGSNPPETLAGAYLPLPVPAPGSPIDTDGDGIPDETELKYGLDPTDPDDADDDPDNDGIPSNTEILQGGHPNAPWVRYFAEGINSARFNTAIAIANSSAATMEVQVTFFRQSLAAVKHNLTLTGKTRVLLNSATVPGLADAAFGVEIAANEAVAADRTTSWDLGGVGGHSERAVESSPTWYFAEGATTGRFSLFYLLTNPQATAANATVTFLRQVGDPIVRQVVIPPFARYTIPVNTTDPGLASADLGGIVTADQPIVAERSMYLSTPTATWDAGTGGTGVTAPSTRWFFGEGAAGDFFDCWILLSNPGSTDATVEVRYVADNGADVTRTHIVRAGHRITVRVVDEDPSLRNTSFGTTVTSTNSVPVVAERAMWWRAAEGGWTSGHVGVGFTAGGTRWVTADGIAATDGSNDTYALITNTDGRAGMVKITALFDDGTAPVEKLYAINPFQRFTVRGRTHFPEVVGKGYSFVIDSIGAAPVDIVVDHSTYWNAGGRFWGAGTTAPASKIK